MSSDTRVAGIASMTAAAALFATMDALVKLLTAHYPVPEVMAFRSAVALLVLTPLVTARGWRRLATRRPWAHAVRSALGLTAIGCFFLALQRLPLAQVIGISFAAPLVMTALSGPLLGEKVGPRRWIAVTVGFAGVLLIVRPDSADWNVGLVAALAGTLIYALVMVLLRDMGRTEATLTIVFWFSLGSTVATGALLPVVWVTPQPDHWWMLAAVGALGAGAQLLATRAVRLAPVAVVAPFDYLHLVFATGYGWALWRDWPTLHTLAGSAIIMAAGLYVVHREARGHAD